MVPFTSFGNGKVFVCLFVRFWFTNFEQFYSKLQFFLLLLFFKNFINCLSVFTVSTSAEEWKVNVVKELDALVKSCVVIPCSFTHPYGNLPSSKLKGNWHLSNKQDHRIYDEDIDEVIEKFKGRTKLLGHLGQNNCTLEIVKVKDYDNGPFCLQIGIFQEEAQTTPNTTHFFVDNCVRFKILRMLLKI